MPVSSSSSRLTVALGHLPCLVGVIDAPPDEHLAVLVQQHDADSAAVLLVVVAHAGAITALSRRGECFRDRKVAKETSES
jgi:hypothetical protein